MKIHSMEQRTNKQKNDNLLFSHQTSKIITTTVLGLDSFAFTRLHFHFTRIEKGHNIWLSFWFDKVENAVLGGERNKVPEMERGQSNKTVSS